ncbi:hypothetical protein D3C87_1727150 [compost metagenome]
MPNSAPRASEDFSGRIRNSFSPSAAPATPVMTTNNAVRSGTPPTFSEIAMANGELTERGSRLRRSVPSMESRLARAQAVRIAVPLPTTMPNASTGQ